MIDISAGDVATGEKTIADVGQQIFDMILDVASGIKQPYSDQHGFHNDMCIFNPAPITILPEKQINSNSERTAPGWGGPLL